jgi:putative inorganic carbon (HCO3(-)) transporter
MLTSIYNYFHYNLFVRKLNSFAGIVLLCLFAVFFAFFTVMISSWSGAIFVGLLVAVIVFMVCIIFPLQGFYVTSVIATFAFYPERLLGFYFPVSVGLEFLILAIYLGVLLKTRNSVENNSSFFRAPTSLGMISFLLFVLVEGFNSNMLVYTGWIFYVRRYSEFLMIYYSSYKLINSIQRIRFFSYFWIFMGLINALYTCKQQWFGFFGFEWRYLRSDPLLLKIYFQGDNIRKISFLSDPAINGIWMACMAIFTTIIILGKKNIKHKILLIGIVFLMMLAMTYTGTRTATLVLIGGYIFYALMTINKRSTIYFVVYGTFIFALLLFFPIDNSNLNRFRSAFRGSQEASLVVRDVNRKMIQPYIYAHPMGGGLGTSGLEGWRFQRKHPLAGFPPDSGFLKAAIEMGWIGFTVTMLNYFVMAFQGVHYYFKTRNREIRGFLLAFHVTVVTFIIAQYTQVSIGQFPIMFFFYPLISLCIRLLDLDRETYIVQKSKNE